MANINHETLLETQRIYDGTLLADCNLDVLNQENKLDLINSLTNDETLLDASDMNLASIEKKMDIINSLANDNDDTDLNLITNHISNLVKESKNINDTLINEVDNSKNILVLDNSLQTTNTTHDVIIPDQTKPEKKIPSGFLAKQKMFEEKQEKRYGNAYKKKDTKKPGNDTLPNTNGDNANKYKIVYIGGVKKMIPLKVEKQVEKQVDKQVDKQVEKQVDIQVDKQVEIVANDMPKNEDKEIENVPDEKIKNVSITNIDTANNETETESNSVTLKPNRNKSQINSRLQKYTMQPTKTTISSGTGNIANAYQKMANKQKKERAMSSAKTLHEAMRIQAMDELNATIDKNMNIKDIFMIKNEQARQKKIQEINEMKTKPHNLAENIKNDPKMTPMNKILALKKLTTRHNK